MSRAIKQNDHGEQSRALLSVRGDRRVPNASITVQRKGTRLRSGRSRTPCIIVASPSVCMRSPSISSWNRGGNYFPGGLDTAVILERRQTAEEEVRAPCITHLRLSIEVNRC